MATTITTTIVAELEAAGAAPGLLHPTDDPSSSTAQWSDETAEDTTCCEMIQYTGPGAIECDMRPCALPLGHPAKWPHQASEDGRPLPMPQDAPQKPQDASKPEGMPQVQVLFKDLPGGLPRALQTMFGLVGVPASAARPTNEEYQGDGVDVAVADVVNADPPEIPPRPPTKATWTPQLAPGVRRTHAATAMSYGWSQERLLQLHRLAKTLGVYTMEVSPQAVYLGTIHAGAWLAAYHEREMDEVWGALMHGQSSFVAYTDGSGTRKGQPSGLGVVLVRTLPNDVDPTGKTTREEIRYVSENCGPGTNNHAELSAVWRALTMVPDLRRPLVIRADSLYAVGCATDPTWKIRANTELVSKIRDDLSRRSNVRFEHVRGHSGDKYNEMADRLANQGRKGR